MCFGSKSSVDTKLLQLIISRYIHELKLNIILSVLCSQTKFNLPLLKYTLNSLKAFFTQISNVPDFLWQFSKILTNSGWRGKCELCCISTSWGWWRCESHITFDMKRLIAGRKIIIKLHIFELFRWTLMLD